MVDPANIKTSDDLKDWLLSLPRDTPEEEARARQIAITIAYRAAARVFPIAAARLPTEMKGRDNRDLTSLSLYRALAISSVAAIVPTDDIGAATAAATATATAAAAATATAATAAAATATAAARVLTFAAAAATATATAAARVLTFAADAASAADARSVEDGRDLREQPLWLVEAPSWVDSDWQRAKTHLAEAPDDWTPVIEWYEHLLDPEGQALNLDMMTEIALIDPEIWDAGPSKALPVIGEIWRRYRAGSPSEDHDLFDLTRATLYRFTLDQVARLMRAVQPPEDWKRLEDPDALARLLADVDDLIEDVDLVCLSLEREGTALQGGGTARTYLESIRDELSRAEERRVLRVSKFIEWVRLLDGQVRREEVRSEFGAVADPFASVVDGLGALIREHFAHVLLRLSDLRGLDVEEEESHRAVLQTIRQALSLAAEGDGEAWRPLAPEDVAVFEDMIESVDRMIRDMDRA
ncbi:hypothetical protein JANAI62_01140 [Jannaschia pagri]|uniref:Uncharacterized protein n=1 Tax=Jannaschia pagri TaxID=2829797 RepID=A0ABQ4NGD6_9RHOB|nr:hypothetical protein [Jannaschia sp. AI_62]GIT93491.1 hypothetical protein JANAI62_01140 [Jannaschia sp. AI_62]